MKNIAQDKIYVKSEIVCEHKFVFSHQSQEAKGTTGTYQTVYYVICEKCGLIKSQNI